MITVGPAPAAAQQRGGDKVDGGLAPAGPLHHQGAASVGHQRLDRGPLVLAQLCTLAGQGAQVRLGPRPQRAPSLVYVAGCTGCALLLRRAVVPFHSHSPSIAGMVAPPRAARSMRQWGTEH